MIATDCPNCGTALDGAFCRQCGQRAPQPDDFRARRFFGMLWDELTDLDSRSLRTLRALFVPGELTRAWIAREWRRYLPPLRLYLVVSAVFFLFGWDPLTDLSRRAATESPEMLAQFPPQHRAPLTDPKVLRAASEITAWARFAGVLLMAVWVALWQGPRRHPFGVHLTFATHYYCFDFVFLCLTLLPLTLLADGLAAQAVLQGWLGVNLVVLLGWTTLALRRAYRRSWPIALLGALAIVAADVMLSSFADSFGLGVALARIEHGG